MKKNMYFFRLAVLVDSGSNKKSNGNESSVYHFVGATVAVGKSCKGS